MTHPQYRWRLIYHDVAPGTTNMAIDDAILEAVISGEVPPTLRLYAWEPPCLSLGFAQPVSDVSIEALKERGWDLVRRPTGGRAILHADELTYSVCSSIDDPIAAGGVLESYKTLAVWLLNALQLLGIEADIQEKQQPVSTEKPKSNGSNQNPVCFEVSSSYEITVNGRKIIGSAQVRRKRGVMQHGSLPLKGDLTRINQVLNLPNCNVLDESILRLLEHATTVERVLGETQTWDTAAQAFTKAFSQTFDLEFQIADLTSSERYYANKLVKEKFSNWKWTERI